MPQDCEFKSVGDGRYAVSGDLGFESVPDVLEKSRGIFERGEGIEVDLSGVTSSDSAALALLIEWIRLAREREIPIVYAGLPDQLLALAGISDLDDVFAELTRGARVAQGSPDASSSSSHSSSSSRGSIGGSPS
jgi:phospholipid transport system transporter-binding protein